MRSRTFVPSRVGATLVALLVVAFALAQVPASGSAGGGVNLQAAPPTAATVPPERTVPRITTAHRTTTRKKVVRKSVTTVKQATTAGSTKVTGTTIAGGSTTKVMKALRATVNGSGSYVAVRAEPDPKSALLRRIPDGTIVSIGCQMIGVSVADPGLRRKSAVWNRLTTGGYMTNLYSSLYRDGETKPTVGHVCSRSTSVSGTEGSGSSATTTTQVPSDGGPANGKVPTKPAVTAVS